MKKQFLHQDWTLRALGGRQVPSTIAGQAIPASIPGCVHTDLMSAGLIPDPYFDRNEQAVQWIGLTDWAYTCRFAPDPDLLAENRLELVCEGLDTVAEIELNGKRIGCWETMHVPCRLDVKDHVQAGENELVITFRSALQHARDTEARLGTLPHAFAHPYNFIRKMACNFGWDWSPTLITAGIYRPIRLEAWSIARIEAVRPLVAKADEELAELEVWVDLAWDPAVKDRPIEVWNRLSDPGGRWMERIEIAPAGTKTLRRKLLVRQPMLWWPRGYGDQPLYDLTVLVGPATAPLDVFQARVGMRQVRLNTEADEIGSRFVLEINGRDVFCKGANWVPDDCFPARVDEARYRRRIGQAAEAGMNMLRVWGGGLYEAESFYRICDELGMLVWQDFLFACAAYPEEPPFDVLVEAEARHQIARLSRHPSLVLWCGSNESIWGWFDWGWREGIAGRTWGKGFYLDVLPKLLAELDPSRPYWPSSPYSGSMDLHPLEDAHGNKHVWDVGKAKDYRAYRQHLPRFVSEFGYQAPASFPVLRKAIPPDQWDVSSPAMRLHQKGPGNEVIDKLLAEHFERPVRFEDWVYLSQLNQARAVCFGLEWWRSQRGRCMGTLYWQLNDGWPAISWSAIDYLERPKLLWYATRRAYADRMLTIQPDQGRLALLADNDSDQGWEDKVTIGRLGFDGRALATETVALNIPPRSGAVVCELAGALAKPDDPTAELIVAQAGAIRALWFFDVDKNLRYGPPEFEAKLSRKGEAKLSRKGRVHILTLTARTLLRDVAVLADYLADDARVTDQLLTLLSGESARFEIHSARAMTKEELISWPVFQCANRFGRR